MILNSTLWITVPRHFMHDHSLIYHQTQLATHTHTYTHCNSLMHIGHRQTRQYRHPSSHTRGRQKWRREWRRRGRGFPWGPLASGRNGSGTNRGNRNILLRHDQHPGALSCCDVMWRDVMRCDVMRCDVMRWDVMRCDEMRCDEM